MTWRNKRRPSYCARTRLVSDAVTALSSVIILTCAVGTAEQERVRDDALAYLRRRYPRDVHIDATPLDDGARRCLLTIKCTDPDWVSLVLQPLLSTVSYYSFQPFDHNGVELELVFPCAYPCAPLHARVVGPHALPTALMDVLNERVAEYTAASCVAGRDDCVCTVRAFLRWFDRHMRKMFIDGLEREQKMRAVNRDMTLIVIC